jgi:hypothetical protein
MAGRGWTQAQFDQAMCTDALLTWTQRIADLWHGYDCKHPLAYEPIAYLLYCLLCVLLLQPKRFLGGGWRYGRQRKTVNNMIHLIHSYFFVRSLVLLIQILHLRGPKDSASYSSCSR